MAITLAPVFLDSPFGDSEGRLAMRDGRLFAVLSRLSDLHDALRGSWFVEATFGEPPVLVGQTFASLDQFAQSAAALLDT